MGLNVNQSNQFRYKNNVFCLVSGMVHLLDAVCKCLGLSRTVSLTSDAKMAWPMTLRYFSMPGIDGSDSL